jgi:shikimate 5-dehydrogenase
MQCQSSQFRTHDGTVHAQQSGCYPAKSATMLILQACLQYQQWLECKPQDRE